VPHWNAVKDIATRWIHPRPTPDHASTAAVARLSSALMTVTSRNLARFGDGQSVVQQYCAAITAAADPIALAWCWFGTRDTDEIVPQVVSGRARAWAQSLRIRRSWLTRKGPAFKALRGEPSDPFDVTALALWGPWRRAAREFGIRSVLCVPLPSTDDDRCGVFVVYSHDAPFLEATSCMFGAVGQLFGGLMSQAEHSAALARAALTDELTGVGNRRALQATCAEIDLHAGPVRPVMLVALDIDHFKRVNDVHGHPAGDAVLKVFAQTLRHCVRATDEVLRLGGEEFLVVLRGTTEAQGLALAEEMRRRVSASAITLDSGVTLHITCSIGLASCTPERPTRQALAAADAALYRAKVGGRDKVELAPRPPERSPRGDLATQ
jgi:diguanylate cyclase (GGDEF)-like protein